jgi:hypothetical protein
VGHGGSDFLKVFFSMQDTRAQKNIQACACGIHSPGGVFIFIGLRLAYKIAVKLGFGKMSCNDRAELPVAPASRRGTAAPRSTKV